jgi:replicative DNA helicase
MTAQLPRTVSARYVDGRSAPRQLQRTLGRAPINQMMAVSGRAQIIIGKQRRGPVGTVTCFGNRACDYQVTPYGR